MGEQPIHYMGHVRMMAAAQPFISGAISKTVNMPEEATVEEVEQLFVESWRLGLKAVAIYRDNCKVAQPLSADKKKTAEAAEAEPAVLGLVGEEAAAAVASGADDARSRSATPRATSPPARTRTTVSARSSSRPRSGARRCPGSWMRFSIAVSVGLQYGVPLEDYVSKFINMKFEPSGA